MPLLMVSYLLQFLDKQTLNFASVMGMIQDLVRLTPRQPLPYSQVYTDNDAPASTWETILMDR